MKWSLARPLLSSFLLILPAASTPTGLACPAGFYPGTDTVIQAIPYPYQAALGIIQSFKNLTWSGTPDDKVSLDGPNNVPGTTRTYELLGVTIKEYVLSPAGFLVSNSSTHPGYLKCLN